MTTIDSRIVNCPYCNTKQKVSVYGSITANKDHHLKQKILDGSIFKQECSMCHRNYEITNDLFYNDTEKKQALWLSQFSLNKEMEDGLDAFSFLVSKGYCKRLAYNPDEFREKVMIFNSGLNDLYVHMIKFSVGNDNDIKTSNLLFSSITRSANSGIEIHFYMPENDQYVTMSDLDNPLSMSSKWDCIEQYLDWIHVDDNNFLALYQKYGHLLN